MKKGMICIIGEQKVRAANNADLLIDNGSRMSRGAIAMC